MSKNIKNLVHISINGEEKILGIIIPHTGNKEEIISKTLELLFENNELIKSTITNQSYIQISIFYYLDNGNSDYYQVVYYMKRHIFLPNEYYMVVIKPTSEIKLYYDNNGNGIKVMIGNDFNEYIKEVKKVQSEQPWLDKKEIVGPTKITDTNTIKYLRCLFMDKGCPTQLPTMYYYY